MHRISLSTASLHPKNPFHISKTKPRKALSLSPFKLFGESISHELGPYYQTIDLRIGNQHMILDIDQGRWKLGTYLSNDLIHLHHVFFLQQKQTKVQQII